MAKKKPAKKKKFVPKKVKEPELGFFERFKDVIPQQKKETVRVKTFIVEKPVYVPAPRERILPPRQKYNFIADEEPEEETVRKIDSSRSRYAKKRVPQRDGEMVDADEMAGAPEDDAALGEGDIGGEGFDEADQEGMDAGEEGFDEEGAAPMAHARTHVRSRAMFTGVWWKRGLFWGILFWLIILAVETLMGLAKLVEVVYQREWWYLLIIILLICIAYERFFRKEPAK